GAPPWGPLRVQDFTRALRRRRFGARNRQDHPQLAEERPTLSTRLQPRRRRRTSRLLRDACRRSRVFGRLDYLRLWLAVRRDYFAHHRKRAGAIAALDSRLEGLSRHWMI